MISVFAKVGHCDFVLWDVTRTEGWIDKTELKLISAVFQSYRGRMIIKGCVHRTSFKGYKCINSKASRIQACTASRVSQHLTEYHTKISKLDSQ